MKNLSIFSHSLEYYIVMVQLTIKSTSNETNVNMENNYKQPLTNSVQFHPEHMAGPTDLEFLFDMFLDEVKRHKSNQTQG